MQGMGMGIKGKNMNHTFLFQERTWMATGNYSDPNNNIIQVEGETKIIHLLDK